MGVAVNSFGQRIHRCKRHGVGCGGTHNAQREDAVERRSQRREGHEECSPLLGREQAIGSRDERHTPGV